MILDSLLSDLIVHGCEREVVDLLHDCVLLASLLDSPIGDVVIDVEFLATDGVNLIFHNGTLVAFVVLLIPFLGLLARSRFHYVGSSGFYQFL